MSSKNSSRFQYSNGPRSTSDGEKTPISSNEYLPQVSNASYSGGYLSNINETGDDVYRPPKALPTANSSYENRSHFNPYSEEVQDTDGYEEPQHNQLHHVASYNGFQPPPPPPPPVTSQHTASSSEHYLDSSSEYAETDRQAPSRAPQYEYPEAGPSNIGIEDEENWDPNSYAYADGYDGSEALVPGHEVHRATEMLRSIADYSPRGRLELHDEPQDEYWEDEDEDDESRFVNFSLLSHIAVQLRDKVPRGTHVKGSIPYPRAFTGKDIVVCSFQFFFSFRCNSFLCKSTIQLQIQRELAINHGVSTNDRRTALQVARSLQSQLFFYEVEWGSRILMDGVEDVYMFLDDQEGGSDAIPEREELPTGVITMLTRCYSPSCGDGISCYAYSCPRKVCFRSFELNLIHLI